MMKIGAWFVYYHRIVKREEYADGFVFIRMNKNFLFFTVKVYIFLCVSILKVHIPL